MIAIEAADLSVVRGGQEVLHDLTFTVREGAVTGLLGPSGCGKTTLMRALVGVQQGVTGQLTVLGAAPGARRHEVGYVTQAPSVYADLTVGENLGYFAKVLGASSTQCEQVLEQVGLADRARQVVGSLSGGQRARVSLATALLGAPRLLVLDEPTVGLDPVLRRDLWQLFHALAGRGVTLVVSSHVMDEAARCDHLLLMRDGRLVADASPQELLARTGAADVEGAFLALAER